MICRLRIDTGNGTPIIRTAVGDPKMLANAAYDAGALGVTVMVLS
ncbi:MAG: hypothetical protein JWP38_3696 [Herbaspirillum sp.]|nr:hypothetical protein [Herbaspirillum sp.]